MVSTMKNRPTWTEQRIRKIINKVVIGFCVVLYNLSLCAGTFSPGNTNTFELKGGRKVEIYPGTEYNATRTYDVGNNKEVKSTLTIVEGNYSKGITELNYETGRGIRKSFDMRSQAVKVPPKHVNIELYKLDDQGKWVSVSNEHIPIKPGLEEKRFDMQINRSKYFPPAPRGLEHMASNLHAEARAGALMYKAPGTTEFVPK